MPTPSVSHSKLLERLKHIGLNNNLLRWMGQFLTSRTMGVKIRGSLTELIRVLSGVPQGSVIGPLLFLLFVNDLPDWVVSSLKMFADNTKLRRTIIIIIIIIDSVDSATLLGAPLSWPDTGRHFVYLI